MQRMFHSHSEVLPGLGECKQMYDSSSLSTAVQVLFKLSETQERNWNNDQKLLQDDGFGKLTPCDVTTCHVWCISLVEPIRNWVWGSEHEASSVGGAEKNHEQPEKVQLQEERRASKANRIERMTSKETKGTQEAREVWGQWFAQNLLGYRTK